MYHKLVHFSFQFPHKYNFEFFPGMKIPAIPFMRETPQAYLLTFAMFLAGAKVCFLATIMHHIFSFYFLKHTLMLLVILLMKYSARESPLCPRSPYIRGTGQLPPMYRILTQPCILGQTIIYYKNITISGWVPHIPL